MAPSRAARFAGTTAAALVVFFIAVRRVGLAPHDVLLAFTIGGFAMAERWRGTREREGLLGEGEVKLRWWDFVCEHHNVLGCIVRGKNRRTRSERILALAVSTLALLYWKALLRPPPVRVKSLNGLRHSLWTLIVTKLTQWVMKRLIRIFAGRHASWQASAGWAEALQLQWQISQYWTIGFMLLCVLLTLLEGELHSGPLPLRATRLPSHPLTPGSNLAQGATGCTCWPAG